MRVKDAVLFLAAVPEIIFTTAQSIGVEIITEKSANAEIKEQTLKVDDLFTEDYLDKLELNQDTLNEIKKLSETEKEDVFHLVVHLILQEVPGCSLSDHVDGRGVDIVWS